MLNFIELLKVIFLGIVEGITEWLPVSSTGHMLLVDEVLQLNASQAFKDMFFILIQLGAILAVVVLFWHKMLPFQVKERAKPFWKKDTLLLWLKVIVACIPGAVVTLLFDDYIEAHLHTPNVIAAALIVYGVAFILVENWNKTRRPRIRTLADVDYRTAFLIGMFQVLSIIPGTSRSGSTIIGALILGVSRVAAAEFTFRRAGHVWHERAQAFEVWLLVYGRRACNAFAWHGGGVPRIAGRNQVFDGLYQKARFPRVRLVPNRPGRAGAGLFPCSLIKREARSPRLHKRCL